MFIATTLLFPTRMVENIAYTSPLPTRRYLEWYLRVDAADGAVGHLLIIGIHRTTERYIISDNSMSN